MKPEGKRYTAEVGGKTMTFETGILAGQAGGAVTLQLGETLLFCSATMGGQPREGINFFPLSVDFEERMYAGGRIPGSFFRREGRPTENAILTSRLTDRPLRPLFPKDMRNEVQIIIYALSADEENIMDVMAINTASAALSISNIPWNGPVAAVRVAQVDGEFIANPTYSELAQSKLDLRVAGTKKALLMVECGAEEVDEDVMSAALEYAHKSMQPLIEAQEKMTAEIGKPKSEYPSFAFDEDFKKQVNELAVPGMNAHLDAKLSKHDLRDKLDELRDEVISKLVTEDGDITKKDVTEAFESDYGKVVRQRIIEKGVRPDGRLSTEVRPIWCDTDYSPRAHGSGIFTRGETQVLTVATLGTPRDAQRLDNLTPEDEKRYMHHYNFPPFSVGEVRFLRGASRREIGHGALAERALIPVIPSEEDFPYTLRLVSECMSSNGSTSMGSVCGSSLALMDAGVPIKAPVSGIAMGLVTDGDKYVILSDIQGVEDHVGDMDFKVAGTENGITALQMDIKIEGITPAMMSEALTQAKEGRAHILGKMMETISEPRENLKDHAPHITTVKIAIDKIGAIIGPGGKTIRAIQDETGAKIDINDDGTVFIATADGESEKRARERIQALTETPELGRIYTGKVVRVTDFGAFVEILPGQDGLVHISQLDSERVESVESVASVGDEITVMVTNVGADGKVRLSRKAVLEGWTIEEAMANDQPNKKSGGNRGGNRGGSNRGGGNRGRR